MTLSTNEKVATTIAVIIAFALTPAFFFLIQDSNSESPVQKTFEASTIKESLSKTYRTPELFSDLRTQDLIQGNGKEANFGDTIYVHYVGLLENGKTFDTSTNSSVPFVVNLGTGEVISGWDVGIVGMRVGGTRRLTIPPELGYGSQEVVDSYGDTIIPANSTLIFDVVLLSVQ